MEEILGIKLTDLTRPEGNEGTEGEAGLGSGPAHLSECSTHRDGEGASRAGLDLDLGHFQGAEGNIGKELGRGGTSKPDRALVFCRVLFTGQVHVRVLEEFVETVLEHSLEGIADEGGAKALPETPGALLCGNGAKT